MKTLFLSLALSVKPDLRDVIIEDLKVQIALLQWHAAERAKQDAGSAHAAAMAAATAKRLELCRKAGGKTVEDCTYDPAKMEVKKK